MEMHSKKLARIKRQTFWRTFNSVAIILLFVAVLGLWKIIDTKTEHAAYLSEISQLLSDEGVKYKVYKDSLGKRTVGVGHLLLPDEKYVEITPKEVLALLAVDYQSASESVHRNYPWASGDVKLVLTNMTFQLGANGLSKFENMLAALEREDYQVAAYELMDSKWARQTPNRSYRLVGRILQLDSAWW